MILKDFLLLIQYIQYVTNLFEYFDLYEVGYYHNIYNY